MVTADTVNPLEERHYTISELAEKWNLSAEFVRQILRGEPGVTEWVRQRPGRRRYRVIRVPQSVAERLYRRAQSRADVGETPIQGQDDTRSSRERQRRGRY